MAVPVSVADVLKLSVAERIQLVEDIWDSIAAVPEAVPLTAEQRGELDRRLDAYHRDPAAGAPWQEVREHMRREHRAGCHSQLVEEPFRGLTRS